MCVLALDDLPTVWESFLSLNLSYLLRMLIKISGKPDIGIFHMSDIVQCLRFNVRASAEMLPLEKKRVFQVLLCQVALLLSASYCILLLSIILIRSLSSEMMESYRFALALQSLGLRNLCNVQCATLPESNHLSSRGQLSLGFSTRKSILLAGKFCRLDYSTL